MAEEIINARIGLVKFDIPSVRPNVQSLTLQSGVVVEAPIVALAYSYAALAFEGNLMQSGNKIVVECDGNSIVVTLNHLGQAHISLVPFIRNAVLKNKALDNPLYCGDDVTFQRNNFRGSLTLSITEEEQEAITMNVNYIFGNYAPKGDGDLVDDVWMDYDANNANWLNVDSAVHYDEQGMPEQFEYNWCNIDKVLVKKPSGDFMTPIPVAWYYGAEGIKFSRVNYHFRYDCRTINVVKVRWLDTDGNINGRKFTLAGHSHGASSNGSWQRQHTIKEIVNGYNRGKDEWANVTANETITIGDDAIPISHYDLLKTLASSSVVEAFLGGVWTRCNVGDVAMDCDPRKSFFSITLTLIIPTNEGLQF